MAKTVLIVDDDQYIRELYEEVMKDAGYEVNTASDGQEGLAELEAKHYDLVLLDVMMPKLDGIGLLKKLHEHPPKTKVGTIIILTNLGHDPIIKEAMAMGATTWLIKADLTPDQLLANVQKYA